MARRAARRRFSAAMTRRWRRYTHPPNTTQVPMAAVDAPTSSEISGFRSGPRGGGVVAQAGIVRRRLDASQVMGMNASGRLLATPAWP